MSALLVQSQQSNYHNNCDFILESAPILMPLTGSDIGDASQTITQSSTGSNNSGSSASQNTSGESQTTMEQQYSQYSVFNSPPASNEMILEQNNFTLNQAHHQQAQQQQQQQQQMNEAQISNSNIQNDDNQQLAELFKCTLGDNDFADPFQQIEGLFYHFLC